MEKLKKVPRAALVLQEERNPCRIFPSKSEGRIVQAENVSVD